MFAPPAKTLAAGAFMGQCICLHGAGTDDLQFHGQCKGLQGSGVAVRSLFRPARYRVCLPYQIVKIDADRRNQRLHHPGVRRFHGIR